MTSQLTEDDLYRTSTQLRLWSFAPEKLASLRAATHSAAVERAKGYLAQHGETNPDVDTLCLTLEEEVRLVQRYCELLRMTSDHFNWPVNVKATAVQYLKRFYLTNSCITYPPKELYKSVLFLASKTEGTHMTLAEFTRKINSTGDQVLAPEYKVIQALRFTLDVRQPFRGLKGILMELLNLASGTAAVISHVGKTATALQEELASLPPPPSTAQSTWTPQQTTNTPTDRAHTAYTFARTILDAPALLTDVYFLYTPPQIAFAALRLSDPVLSDFYLRTKLPASSPMTARILSTISDCAAMLASYDKSTIMSKEERERLEKKLDGCRDPSTKDMVSVAAKAKRADAEEGKLDAGVAKRRKLQREASMREGEELFGPSLKPEQTGVKAEDDGAAAAP